MQLLECTMRLNLKQQSISGPLWKVVEGQEKGQTAVNKSRYDNYSIFCDPIDLHFGTRGIQGWPKLSIEVFSVNSLDQFYPVGFGFAYLPTKPGLHSLSIATWKISPATFFDSVKEKFFTGGFTIVKKDLIHSGIERYKISTISAGIVEVQVNLVFKNFRRFNIHFD